QGIGRRIIELLEADEYAKRADKIVIHSAISAIPFYRKLGYEHKNGELHFENGTFFLEKRMGEQAGE
ncbi:MAG: GNAT family N-acetyltransferase, partial [Treponemataceae bacterium]|nr:GNAT family N-acetyltransferase [Treponemataceae bacterium]